MRRFSDLRLLKYQRMNGSPKELSSHSDTGIRDECHINKSPLTFHDGGLCVMRRSQNLKVDKPQRLVWTLELRGFSEELDINVFVQVPRTIMSLFLSLFL